MKVNDKNAGWDGLKFLGSAGAQEILEHLVKVKCNTFTGISKETRLHKGTLSKRLRELVRHRLVNEKDVGGYEITPRGTLIYKWASFVNDFKTPNGRTFKVRKFQETEELPGLWTMDLFPLLAKTQDELLVISKFAGSVMDTEYKKIYQDIARKVQKRLEEKGKRIRMILDPKIKEPNCKEVYQFWSSIAEIRFFSNDVLQEKPKGIIDPIIVNDLGHLLIFDRMHWLYIEPHKHETGFTDKTHRGIITENDPLTARYLADAFESLWWLLGENRLS
ncbi:MAG: winged helix-turn-helix domain-containing protein [Candidatus Hodarchaeota archaeon]